MKNKTNLFLTAAVAALAGAVFSPLATAQFTAAVPLEVIGAAAATLVVAGLAVYDYSRQPAPLRRPGVLLRPATPIRPAATTGTEATRLVA